MKKLVRLLICLTLFLTIVGISHRTPLASGFPVIDISNLLQNTQQALKQIMELQELLKQGTDLANQYKTILDEYQRALEEYGHYLKQIEGLRDKISDQDWQAIMELILSYYGESERSEIVEMDPDEPDYEDQVDETLAKYGYVPPDPAEVEFMAKQLGIWSDQYRQEVEEDYRNFNLYKDRMRMVSKNNQNINQMSNMIARHQDTVSNLGDESDLATLQEIALENITLMKQNEYMLHTLNQLLLHAEGDSRQRAAQRAKARYDEQQRLKKRNRARTLGRDRWGSF